MVNPKLSNRSASRVAAVAAAEGLPDNRPISVYHLPSQALTLCPQHCVGIQSGAGFPARSADACPQLCMGISARRYTEIGPLLATSQDYIRLKDPRNAG